MCNSYVSNREKALALAVKRVECGLRRHVKRRSLTTHATFINYYLKKKHVPYLNPFTFILYIPIFNRRIPST